MNKSGGGLRLSDKKIVFESDILNKVFPVGSLYLNINSTSPSSLFGGTWEKLPEGYALWTATSGAGGVIASGLPNIKGRVHGLWGCRTFDHSPEASDSLWLGSQITEGSAGGNGWKMYLHDVQLDASMSSGIYGNYNIVQPPAYKIYAWKRIS